MTGRRSYYLRAGTCLAVVWLAILTASDTTEPVRDARPAPTSPNMTEPIRGGTVGSDAWYVPVEEEFRPAYDSDAANKKVQTWAQYWGWVTSFYRGNLFHKGWTFQVTSYLDGVSVEAQRRRLRSEFNALGRDLCREWAKDNGVRKVGTGDLRRYAAMLEGASRADDGTGRRLLEAIDSVRGDYRRKMGGM
jgi:hypothetical protein